jgi:hypothetical protein
MPPEPLQLPELQVPPVPQLPVLATQVRLAVLQHAPAPLQPLSAQQGWVLPPQVLQTVSRQIWWSAQLLPLRMQTLETQQPPPVQVSPRQQAAPGAPQSLQVPSLHTNVPLQKLSEQQGCDEPPHGLQAPPGEHTVPVAHSSPTSWQTPATQQPAQSMSLHKIVGVLRSLAARSGAITCDRSLAARSAALRSCRPVERSGSCTDRSVGAARSVEA